ncbi:MAG: IS1/IS1595 family N-terminal zinc-binding domain-containing protein [Candidatus Bathyarchaeia archaeon]|jgi:transposase-like protein
MPRKIINCPYCGKILPDDLLKGIPKKKTKCPNCGSQKNWKDGMRKMPQGNVQRYLCRDCGTRFTER